MSMLAFLGAAAPALVWPGAALPGAPGLGLFRKAVRKVDAVRQARRQAHVQHRVRDGLGRRDALTGLVDRKVATLWLHAAVGLAVRGERPLALAILTLEGGDRPAVARAARRLKALHANPQDMLAAIGDRTFLVGMRDADPAVARLRLGGLLEALAAEGIVLRGGLAAKPELPGLYRMLGTTPAAEALAACQTPLVAG